MEALLQNLDTVLRLRLRHLGARRAAALMIVLRHPMRVAMALISAMVFLGGVYGLLGVHFIAAFQVLIYVGAVMVFMVYVIMLLDVRDPSYTRRFSRLLVLGIAGAVTFVGVLVLRVRGTGSTPRPRRRRRSASSSSRVAFLNEYWLHFELTSVLLVAAVVAALAVIRGSQNAMDKLQFLRLRVGRAVRAGAPRRHRPAQPARHADVHGADAERRQPVASSASPSRPAPPPARCSCS